MQKGSPLHACLGRWLVPVSAAGVLFVRNNCEVLLATNSTRPGDLEDLGGKVNRYDTRPLDTAAREVAEETNGLVSKEQARDLIARVPRHVYYNARFKYICIVVHVGDDFLPDPHAAGRFEEGEGMGRVISWYPIEEVTVPAALSNRIRSIAFTGHFLRRPTEWSDVY